MLDIVELDAVEGGFLSKRSQVGGSIEKKVVDIVEDGNCFVVDGLAAVHNGNSRSICVVDDCVVASIIEASRLVEAEWPGTVEEKPVDLISDFG